MLRAYDGVRCVTEVMVEGLKQKKREWIEERIDCERMHSRLQRYRKAEEDLRGEYMMDRGYRREKVRRQNAAASHQFQSLRDVKGGPVTVHATQLMCIDKYVFGNIQDATNRRTVRHAWRRKKKMRGYAQMEKVMSKLIAMSNDYRIDCKGNHIHAYLQAVLGNNVDAFVRWVYDVQDMVKEMRDGKQGWYLLARCSVYRQTGMVRHFYFIRLVDIVGLQRGNVEKKRIPRHWEVLIWNMRR